MRLFHEFFGDPLKHAQKVKEEPSASPVRQHANRGPRPPALETVPDDAEYRRLVESAYAGQTLVGVDREYARKLYMNIATSAIEQATGEAPYLEKLVVWFASLAGPVAFLSSAILAVFAFHGWALIIIPAALLWWLFNYVLSARGGAKIWFLTLLLIATTGVYLAHFLPTPWVSEFVAAFVFAMWCSRLIYCASTAFLRAFVLRNQRALNAFHDGITLQEAA